MCAVNFGISVWNANAVGKVWTESKYIGGSVRVLAVCGYIMAIAGFTMVYSIIIIAIIGATKGFGYLSAEQATVLLQFISDLSYILIAFAIIPTGIIITIGSAVSFWKRKSLKGGLVAGWNTFATISNVVHATRAMPSAFGRIISSVKSNRDSGVLVLAIVIVALCVLGGYFTASAIVKRADKKYDLFGSVAPTYAAAGGESAAGPQAQGYPPGAAQGYGQGQAQGRRSMAEREAELRGRSGQ
jgi:hypothetical protein